MTLRRKLLFTGVIVAIIGIILGWWLVSMHTAPAPKPVVAAIKSSSPKLIFDDEFNGSSLDTSKWNTCYDTYSSASGGCTNHGNFESEWYTKNNVSVSNGDLVLTAKKEPTAGTTVTGQPYTYQYSSGMVTTGRYVTDAPPKWTSSYGYFEARINVPSGQGIWPAFWLLPVDHDWPPELDIMELLGNRPNQVLTTYHWKGQPNAGVPQDSSTYTAPASLAGSWHTYAADWEPGYIDWYVDGIRVKHFENSVVTNKPMQIIFDLAVGGTLPGYPDSTTPSQAKMLVDYIRVYEHK